MEDLTQQERLEAMIGKLNSIISAHEELIKSLIVRSCEASEPDAIELILRTKADKYQKWLEFVEDTDPALAAKIDRRNQESLDLL